MAMIALSRGGEKGMDATKEKGAKRKYKKKRKESVTNINRDVGRERK